MEYETPEWYERIVAPRSAGSYIYHYLPQRERMCEEHDRLRADAIAALAEAKRVRRERDISFEEDAELSREAYRRTDALLKHLLVGHDGEPCPAGSRPIVSITPSKA
jgi:hypothetical protein